MAENPFIKTDLARKMHQKMLSGYKANPAASSAFRVGGPWAKSTPDTTSNGTNEPTNPALKIIDVLNQLNYANIKNAQDTAADLVRGDYGAAIKEQFSHDFGTNNNKKTLSDALRGDSEMVNDYLQDAYGGKAPRISGDIGPLKADENDNALQRFGKGAAGFTADVASDPLSYATLGTAGLGVKVLGTAVKGATKGAKVGGTVEKAASAAAKGIDATGNALIKTDNVINDVVGKAIAAPFKGAAAVGRKITGKTAANAAEEVVEAAPAAVSRSVVDNVVPEDLGTAIPTVAPKVPQTQQMLRDVISGETVPVTPEAQAATRYQPSDLISANGQVETPFTQAAPKAVPQAKPVPETVPTATPHKEFRDDWVKSNADTKVAIPTSTGIAPVSRTLTEWIGILQRPTTNPAHKAVINKALAREVTKAWRSADQGAWLSRRTGPDGAAVAAPTGPGAPSAPRPGQSAQADAQAVREASAASDSLDRAQWRDKAPEEVEAVKAAYKETLDADHFEYLYGDYLDQMKTVDERALEFGKRVKEIASTPRYELFYQERVLPWQNALNEEMAGTPITGVKPASEIMRETPTNMEAVAQRSTEEAKQAAGVYLDDTDRRILTAVLGERRSRNGQMIGQMWNKRGEGFDYTTNVTKAKKNSPVLGQGEAVNPAYNAKAQANLMTLLIEDAASQVRAVIGANGRPIAGRARAQMMMQEIIPRVQRIEASLRANGIEPIAGNGVRGIPVSMGDFFSALSQSDRGLSFLERRIFDGIGISKPGQTAQPGTIYMDGALRATGAIVDVLSNPELIDNLAMNPQNYQALTEAVVKMVKEGRTPTHEAVHNALTDFNATPISNMHGPVDLGPKGEPYYGPFSKNVVEEFMQVLFHKEKTEPLRRLIQTVQANSARHGIAIGDNIKELSSEVMREFYDMLPQAKTSHQVDELINGTDNMVSEMAKESPVAPLPIEVDGAKKAVRDGMTDSVPVIDIENAKFSKKIGDKIYGPVADTPLGRPVTFNPKVHTRSAKAAADEVLRKASFDIGQANKSHIIAEAGAGKRYTTDEIIGMTADAGAFGRIGRTLNNAFVPSGQFPTLHAAHMRNGSLSNGLSQQVRRSLTEVARMAMPEDRKAVYALIQRGAKETPEHLIPLREAMEKVTGLMFHNSGEGGVKGITSTFLEQGHQVRDIINRMNAPHYGVPESLHFKPQRDFDYLPPAEQSQAFLKHMATMRVNDPVDFLARMEAVTNSLARDISLSQDAFTVLKGSGGISLSPKDGLVKVHPDDLQKNIVMRYMPHNGELYIAPEIAQELKSLNSIIQTSITPGGGAMKEFLRAYDPILQMMKAGMTVYRVGHHVRNMVGDASMAFLMDGVKSPSVYTKATAMLSNRKAYDGVDMWKMMQGIESSPTRAKAAKAKVKIGNVELSNEEFYDEMMKRGLFKTHLQNEDIARSTDLPDWVRNAQDFIQFRGSAKGKVQQAVGTISEYRDDWGRLAHAIDLVEKGKIDGRFKDFAKGIKDLAHGDAPAKQRWAAFKKAMDGQTLTPDEFMDAVVQRVNMSHPDGSDMTTFERKYLRRIFPFYSWTRKAIPLVLEGMLMNPGRITVVPKFMYNMSIQNGVNPDSLSDPFPDDQLFPSYLADSTYGPLWRDQDLNYYGISPGAADQDIINSFIAGGPRGAINETLGMINPMLKVPVELATGATLGTQIPTPGTNPSEYLGSQIPMLSQAQSISGYDILGSAKNLTPTPLSSVEKGNRDTWGLDKVFNWFSGMQQQNMSTPSAQRRAEFERQEAEG